MTANQSPSNDAYHSTQQFIFCEKFKCQEKANIIALQY